MGNEVFIVSCPDYDQAEEKTADLLTMMGGMGQFAAPGEEIVLKANLLICCYCCHEMCPDGAIELRSSILHRIVGRFGW